MSGGGESMIAELFYPRELKEIIADLRAKDDLNEEALDEIKKSIRFPIVFAFIIFLILIYKHSFLFSLLIGLLIFFLLRFVFQGKVISLSLSYTLGKPIFGIVEDAYFNKYNPGTPNGWNVRYTFERPQRKQNNKREYILPQYMPDEKLKKGDKIQIYIYGQNHQGLFLPKYFEKFCLSISRIKKILGQGEKHG